MNKDNLTSNDKLNSNNYMGLSEASVFTLSILGFWLFMFNFWDPLDELELQQKILPYMLSVIPLMISWRLIRSKIICGTYIH